MNNNLPKRKRPRLKNYDYSLPGAYFVTICTYNKRCILSHIVGRGLAPAEIKYTEYGKIAEEQLKLLEERFCFLKIDRYVIMPNHIHALLILDEKTAGASPRPTIMDIICVYKSLTTRACKSSKPIEKIFQSSFYKHVIRNNEEYTGTLKYIDENPMCWQSDELFSE